MIMYSLLYNIPVLICPYFASGFVYDLTGDFNNSFYLGAVLGFLAGCLALVIVIRVHCVTNAEVTSHKSHVHKNNNNAIIHQKTVPSELNSQIS